MKKALLCNLLRGHARHINAKAFVFVLPTQRPHNPKGNKNASHYSSIGCYGDIMVTTFLTWFCFAFGTIPMLRQQKDWVGGFGNCPFLLTFSTYCIYSHIVVGWVRKSALVKDIIKIPDYDNLIILEKPQDISPLKRNILALILTHT